MNQNKDVLKAIAEEMALYSSETAYKKLFKLLFVPIMRFSQTLVKSTEVAEEIASEVLLKLWEKRTDLTQIDNIHCYAFVMARNLSLNMIKKNARLISVSLDELTIDDFLDTATPERILINRELKLKIEESIQSLPEKGRMVFQLIKEDGFSYKEVAEILNISIKTVDAHLVSAVKKIAEILKKEYSLA